MKNGAFQLRRITAIAMLAAISYVVFTLLQIKISLPGGDATSIHLGNAVCVLGALLMGGFAGGLGGAIGMTIGDLFDPIYVIYAPKTFLLKLGIGLITGFVAHKLGKIDESSDSRHVLRWSAAAAAAGMIFNVIFDPLVGYFYKLWILGKPAAEVTLAWNVASTSINAVLSVVAAVAVYMVLRPALRRAGVPAAEAPSRVRNGFRAVLFGNCAVFFSRPFPRECSFAMIMETQRSCGNQRGKMKAWNHPSMKPYATGRRHWRTN